ncbi:DUF397 domain-containing protein [Streptomyces sp. NRRL B-1677]|uniref:DUF397 domain-containing protein n=1 Tax=Streptomyces klenkii TaxID=1420899 RepID=A0A3B0AQ90_9ACTN|nr:DUF397 domain-containing protein [Streptomyces sp. NRRL B-1677]RKN62975.1 DUF397 domain-containing protein [Streptomyces klenkii]
MPGPDIVTWRKSSYSGLENDCVEVADRFSDIISIRDSKTHHGPIIVLAIDAWSAFVTGLRAGNFPTAL